MLIYLSDFYDIPYIFKEQEIAQGGLAPRILSLDDYYLVKCDSTQNNARSISVGVSILKITAVFFQVLIKICTLYRFQ